MERMKKIGKAALFPPMAVLLILLPVAVVFLVYAMVYVGEKTMIAYVSYVLAFYTLTVWCARVPKLIAFSKRVRSDNKYVRLWTADVRLRMNVSLCGSFLWNLAYGIFQLCLGVYHASFWYCSMAVYYICLAAMRLNLSRHTRKHKPGERMREELLAYRACGWIFLAMNTALALMIFFMVYWNRTFHHHEITTIAMAAYTFTAFAMAVINLVKYRKYESPVYSASKAISLAAACVSMLTLESTMLTTFGSDSMDLLLRKMMLGISGGVISVFIIAMAIYMILGATGALRAMDQQSEQEKEHER